MPIPARKAPSLERGCCSVSRSSNSRDELCDVRVVVRWPASHGEHPDPARLITNGVDQPPRIESVPANLDPLRNVDARRVESLAASGARVRGKRADDAANSLPDAAREPRSIAVHAGVDEDVVAHAQSRSTSAQGNASPGPAASLGASAPRRALSSASSRC